VVRLGKQNHKEACSPPSQHGHQPYFFLFEDIMPVHTAQVLAIRKWVVQEQCAAQGKPRRNEIKNVDSTKESKTD
jgi:hypothetical protein